MNIEVPIRTVTVFEDRARIEREASIELAAGAHRLEITEVSPVLVDQSLTVLLQGGMLVSSTVERIGRIKQEDREQELVEIDERRRQMLRQARRMQARIEQLTQERQAHDKLVYYGLEEASQDAALGRDITATLRDMLESGGAQLESVIDEHQTLLDQAEELAREDRRLLMRRSELEHPGHDMRASVIMTCDMPQAGTLHIDLRYTVAAAVWRPSYQVMIDGGQCTITAMASIWQRSGEDWADVRLRCSSERSSGDFTPPQLDNDRLRLQPRTEKVSVEAREETVHDVGLGGDPATSSVQQMPGIDDGGEVRELQAVDRAKVRSNGKLHRLALFSCESPCEQDLICMPEITAGVVQRSRQTNTASEPFLPGPVELIRNGGHHGRGYLDYTAPGERFELGWGPDPDLVVNRTHHREEKAAGMLSGWRSVSYQIRDHISNSGVEAKQVLLVERVPVSELDEVQIEVESAGGATEPSGPDENGFIRWTIPVPGRTTATGELRYKKKWRSSVEDASA